MRGRNSFHDDNWIDLDLDDCSGDEAELGSGQSVRGNKKVQSNDLEKSSKVDYTWNKVDADDPTQDGDDVKSVNKNEKPYMAPLNTGHSLVLNLEKSLAEYDKYQDKIMKCLISVKDLIGNNNCVALLETKFCKLNIKENDFVAKELNRKVTCSNLPEETDILKVKSPLDDDLCLTPEEWNIIDKCSVYRAKMPMSSAKVFSNMESQSKIVSLELENPGPDFRTPLGDIVFKAPLDPTIPSFNLNIDMDDDNLESNGVPGNQELGKNSNGFCNRPCFYTRQSQRQKLAGTILDMVEQIVEEQSLDPLFPDKMMM
ncbi:hypothetical protein POM88_027930 [Heracleum sosnowskyi]|uniref:Uncharacterized protein n=1 Tax=Heracleum sosnowskyi TaxID=360622 RepID=A0AAD8I8W6_9APIA|nr:hypothetical protein POM88_027930 [Heracleum sosnowskyi]